MVHGPSRIVEHHVPVLALAARDAAEASIAETAERLAKEARQAAEREAVNRIEAADARMVESAYVIRDHPLRELQQTNETSQSPVQASP